MQRNAEQIKCRYNDTGTLSGTYLMHIFVNIMSRNAQYNNLTYNNEILIIKKKIKIKRDSYLFIIDLNRKNINKN